MDEVTRLLRPKSLPPGDFVTLAGFVLSQLSRLPQRGEHFVWGEWDFQVAEMEIELKVSRGHEKTVGQALYYRARIKQRFGAEPVRVFIVAAEISPELRAAASEVSDALLFEYSLAVKVTAITP